MNSYLVLKVSLSELEGVCCFDGLVQRVLNRDHAVDELWIGDLVLSLRGHLVLREVHITQFSLIIHVVFLQKESALLELGMPIKDLFFD